MQCMDGHRMPKIIVSEEIYGRKKWRQPRQQWIMDVEGDLRRMSFQCWRARTQD
jgi:hypothetical protein